MKTLKGFEDIEVEVKDGMVTLTQRRSYTTNSVVFPLDQLDYLGEIIMFAHEATDEST